MTTQTTENTNNASSPSPPSAPLMTLSIAGHASTYFKYFWQDVTRDTATGLPVSGSVGIGFRIFENLMTRFELTGKTWEGFNSYLAKNIWIDEWVYGLKPKNKKGRYISPVAIREIDEFLSFATGNQPFFYLRKGKELMGLCRKTSTYIYDYDPARPGHLPHRINFDFIRPPTEQEREDFMVGPGKSGVTKAIEHQPLRHQEDTVSKDSKAAAAAAAAAEEAAIKAAEEAAIKAAESKKKEEIDTLQGKLSSNKNRIREINVKIRELMDEQKLLVKENLEVRDKLLDLKSPL